MDPVQEFIKKNPGHDWDKYVAEQEAAMKQYKAIAQISSFSEPAKKYAIKQDMESHITCNCPSWVFNSRHQDPRACKHTDVVEQAGGLEKLLLFSGQYDVVIDGHGSKWQIEKKT
jgi:hypothetical protein